MQCKDCGGKILSWQEYCRRCGAELYKNQKKYSSNEHPFLERFFKE